MLAVADSVEAAGVLVDVGEESVTEDTAVLVAQVDCLDVAGNVTWHQEDTAVGTRRQTGVMHGGHVVVQPRIILTNQNTDMRKVNQSELTWTHGPHTWDTWSALSCALS